MSGLNKLMDQIKTVAKTTADSKLEQAQQRAAGLIQEAEDKARKESKYILQEADVNASNVIERAKSTAALQKRRTILSAKQQMIEETIQKTRDTLLNMSSQEYFDLILKMISRYSLPQSGQIIFSEKDRNRLPTYFDQQINQEVLPKGGSLMISSESRPMDGGFVLVYGDVEENCTFEAILDSKSDILQDKIHEFLFA